MSEAWGPRAHPERCCEDIEPDEVPRPTRGERRKNVEESLGTACGVLMLALILAGVILWWVL